MNTQDVLELEFKGRRQEYAANPLQFPFSRGDLAIVETDRGYDLGKVSYVGIRPGISLESDPELRAIRKANDVDVQKLSENRLRELDARRAARKKIREHNLEMKLVDVEMQWDGKKMTFFFTADGRVDFRELVKDLASTFRTRIDLRQIGARDETKKTGGYGVCGRELCCSTFLQEFKPITTQMPRDQYLPLNPSKLSGVCGRLKCCLRYELDIYREFQRNCPKVGHPVKDDIKGEGVIDKLDVVREQIQIKYASGGFDKIPHEEFIQISNWKREMPRTECICTCGKKQEGIALPAVPKDLAPDTDAGLTTGDRITFRDGGLSFAREGESETSISTEIDAGEFNRSKSSRRRRGKKPPSSQSPQASSSPQTPPQSSASVRPQANVPRPQTPKPPVPQTPQSASTPESSSSEESQNKRRRRRGGRRHRRGGGGSGDNQ